MKLLTSMYLAPQNFQTSKLDLDVLDEKIKNILEQVIYSRDYQRITLKRSKSRLRRVVRCLKSLAKFLIPLFVVLLQLHGIEMASNCFWISLIILFKATSLPKLCLKLSGYFPQFFSTATSFSSSVRPDFVV